MNRNKMIKWLQETTIPEQWGDNCQLPKECHWRFTDSRLHDCNYRSVLRTIVPSSESDIFFENIFEQPVFIDGAEYWLYDSSGHGEPTRVRYEVSTNTFYEVGKPFGLKAPASDFGKHFTVELVNVPVPPVFINGAGYFIHPLKDLGLPLEGVKFTYDRNTNRFNGPGKVRLNASDFGKVFTVELVTMGQPPETPDYILTGKGNINALSNYLKLNSTSVDIVAGEALSRLKAQAVIVGRTGKLNEVCQKHSIGSIGDSVIDSIVEHIEKQNSLYERVVKALGKRKVPIGGVDHLVGQVQVDHKKATLLDDVIEEFNIPEGGNIINWLRKDTLKDKEVEGLINGLKQLLDLKPDSTINELFISTEELILWRDALLDRNQPRNKYDREILPGVYIDVYDVLGAFKTDSAAIDHAVKKLLAPGQRGVKDRITDLNEAINSIQREIERLGEWGNK